MIIRVKKNANYTSINNAGAHDTRLSFKTKGLLWYLLTKPDNWEIRIAHLLSIGPDGRDAVRGALKELETYGYLSREKQRRPDGTFEWVSSLQETPVTRADNQEVAITEISPQTGFPSVVKPSVVKPSVANRPLISTEVLSTELPSTERVTFPGSQPTDTTPTGQEQLSAPTAPTYLSVLDRISEVVVDDTLTDHTKTVISGGGAAKRGNIAQTPQTGLFGDSEGLQGQVREKSKRVSPTIPAPVVPKGDLAGSRAEFDSVFERSVWTPYPRKDVSKQSVKNACSKLTQAEWGKLLRVIPKWHEYWQGLDRDGQGGYIKHLDGWVRVNRESGFEAEPPKQVTRAGNYNSREKNWQAGERKPYEGVVRV